MPWLTRKFRMHGPRFCKQGGHGGIKGTLALVVAVAVFFGHDIRRASADGLAVSDHRAPPMVPYPIQLSPGVYLLGNLAPSAAYTVETSAGLVLIDSGLRSDARLVKSQMAAAGFDWRQVRAVLLTHAHIDHSGGAEHLRAETGAKIYAGQGDAQVLRAGGPHEAFFSAFALPDGELHSTKVDVELKGGEVIRFGDVQFRALATPGHTPGSICYLMERAGIRALFTGDVISMFVGLEKSHQRIDKPLGTYSTYLPSRFRGDAKSYLASLRALRALPVPDLVLPGHPRSDPEPQTPCLPIERWQALLDQGIAEMASLVARYDADGADFLDGEPKQLLPDLYYLGEFRGTAIYALFAASRLFLVDAPGGAGLFSFVKDRLKQLGRQPAQSTAVLLTSCDAASTAGLNALVQECHPEVIVSPVGLQQIKKSCPPGTAVLSAEALPARAWFDVTPVPLRAPGSAPIAYRARWGGKIVLISGHIPIKPTSRAEVQEFSHLPRAWEPMLDYVASVYRLAEPKPDLWLPALPVNGQNANLYDSDWPDILADNYRAGYRTLMGRR